MGAGALADKLNIPKAMLVIPGLLSPQFQFDYGAGSHLLATVPQFQSLLPQRMVSMRLRMYMYNRVMTGLALHQSYTHFIADEAVIESLGCLRVLYAIPVYLTVRQESLLCEACQPCHEG